MPKTLCVKKENGDVFVTDVKFVANHRASFLADQWLHNGFPYDETYAEEYRHTMENDDEIISWVRNEMTEVKMHWYGYDGKKVTTQFEIGVKDEIYTSHR